MIVGTLHFRGPLALAGLIGKRRAMRALDALRAASVLAQDEVAAAHGVRHLAGFSAQGVILAYDDGVRDPPGAAVLRDGMGKLAGVVPRPVQGAVAATLDGDQRAVGAGDEA